MNPDVGTMTAEELFVMPDNGMKYELVNGVLRTMSPTGAEHGDVSMNMACLLKTHVRKRRLGKVYGTDTGFILSRHPDTVRAPDVAFVPQSQLSRIHDVTRYVPFAPNLACEVVSPDDSAREVDEKARSYLSAGTQMVIVVEPRKHLIRVYRPGAEPIELDENSALDASDVVPGWTLAVRELFE